MKIINRNKLLNSLLFTIVFFSHNIIFAQRTITGTVKDSETKEGIIGANIIAKEDNTIGTVSDLDGSFSLEIPENVKTIVLSYTGYSNQEFDVSTVNNINVELIAGEILENIVVVGYGTVKREDLTGSIQSVSSDKFNKGSITSPQELLAGKVAGVVVTTDGGPGAGARIRIRGESSISGSNDPLIVIDGIPLDNTAIGGGRNNLNLINPNDIESMSVLKDASAAAIYGNRASGGVILITTKKGKVGSKLAINYNANYSVGKKYNEIDMLSPSEYRKFIFDKYYDETKPEDKQHAAIKTLGTEDTDWQKLVYQDAKGVEHNIGFSGAIDKLPFRISLGYVNKDGILINDNFERYTSSINVNPSFLDNRLQLNLHLKTMINANRFADRGAIGNALNYDPTRGPYDATSIYGGYTTWTVPNGNPNNIAPTNPLALLNQRFDVSSVNHYIANANVSYRLKAIPELLLNLTLGKDRSKGKGSVTAPVNAAFAFDATNGGGLNNAYEQTHTNSIIESYANYKKNIGDHGIDLMAGYSWQHFDISDFNDPSNANGTVTNPDPFDAELFLISVYSRLNYDFKDKYFFTFSLRRDGASRFSPEARWGLFPAAALAVKLMENDHTYFNALKLRTGFGTTGQQDIGSNRYYAYLAQYTASNAFARYQFGNEYITTLRPEEYDVNIKWEENTTYNVALDFSLIKNKLSGSLDVYQKNTKDLLNRIPVPAGSNLSNFLVTNVGNMVNKGIELSLNATPVRGWDFSANFAYNNPKITKLTAIDDPEYPGIAVGGISGGVGSNIQRHNVGYAPSTFYVYKQLYDESGNILEGQYADINSDGIVNSQDFYYYKSPNPKFTIGFTSNVNYKNFDFSFAGRINIGQYVYNNVLTDMGYQARAFASNGVLWGLHQSAVDLNVVNQSSLTFSDHFITEASFLKLDHITLGYNFAKILNGLRLFTTVQNALVITNYKGLDPEIGNGIDNNIYPRPRTFLGGISVNF